MWDFADDGDLYFEKAVSDIIKFGVLNLLLKIKDKWISEGVVRQMESSKRKPLLYYHSFLACIF